jgi:cell division septation protein DedD
MAKAAKTDKKAPTGGGNARRPEGKSRRWVVLMLVSVWMFVLGVLVGRGTSPVHFDTEAFQKELADLRAAVVQKEKKRFRVFESEAAAEKAENLDFYENLKKTPPDSPPSPAAKPAPRPAPAPPRPAEAPAKEATADRAPASAARPAGFGSDEVPASKKPYTIQVASLRESKAADEMVEKLQAGGFPAYRERADIEGKGTWFRVRIGSFAGPTEASPTLESLKKGGIQPMLIRK